MIILGLNFAFHDSSACIIKDGKLIVAIEEERITRKKHTSAFPKHAAAKCMEVAGLDYRQIDHIAISVKPTIDIGKKLVYGLLHLRAVKHLIRWDLIHHAVRFNAFRYWYKGFWGSRKRGPKVHFIEHHLSHGPGTFFVSPYKEAAILSIDGSGEWATTWMGHGKDNKTTHFYSNYFPNSLGLFYETVTYFCGFTPNYDEGKTMGLAPFGDPSVFYNEVEKIISVDDNGKITLDLSYFDIHSPDRKLCSKKFISIFGQPRERNGEFLPHHENVAAAFQKVLEDKVLVLCDILHKKTGAKHLIVAGGVSLNSVMNGRIVRESKFDDVYVMPAAGDNGTAIGAAYYVYNNILKQPRSYVHNDPYIGTEYNNDDILKLIKGAKLKHEYYDDIADKAAELLAEGNIIGWFQGKMEIGPRALGSRSILANPAFPQMKDKINAEVKFREAYRPFAPSCIVEAKNDYFDLSVEAPFMLKVCNVLKEKQSVIPAVTHVDGSARLQTVDSKTHPLYYNLIKKLGEKTGVPVVLNTSFNIQGEPLVESPKDAMRCFFSTGLDMLVIGNYLLRKD